MLGVHEKYWQSKVTVYPKLSRFRKFKFSNTLSSLYIKSLPFNAHCMLYIPRPNNCRKNLFWYILMNLFTLTISLNSRNRLWGIPMPFVATTFEFLETYSFRSMDVWRANQSSLMFIVCLYFFWEYLFEKVLPAIWRHSVHVTFGILLWWPVQDWLLLWKTLHF